MDEKPKCSQDVEPITQQPTKKNENSEVHKEQLVLSKEQIPTTRHQQAYSEDHSDAAKTLTVLSKDQPNLTTEQSSFSTGQLITLPNQLIQSTDQPLVGSTEQFIRSTDVPSNSTEQVVILKEEPAFSNQQSPYLKSQTVLEINQPILSIKQPIYLSHQTVCAEDQLAVPETENVSAKDQSIFSAVQPEFSNEKPVRSEDQSAVPEIQTFLTKIQPISATDQPIFSKEQPGYSKDRAVDSTDQPGYSEDQPVDSTHKPIYSPVLSIHSTNPPRFLQDQPTYSKHQPAGYSKNETAFSRKHESLSPEELTGLSTIHIDPTVHESSSSRELLIAPKIIEAASTKYVSVFPKNEVAKLLGNSINVEYGISLCPTKAASANCMNNGYFLSANDPLKINIATQSPSIPESISLLAAPASAAVAVGTQPASLFLQALSKLNESSLTLAVISHFRLQSPSNLSRSYTFLSGDITPPDSLTSAPPTYSFVLRQIAGRRRPRFMGSFFPSPSFVQRTPPPTYTGAFDVYVEPALPPPPTRTYSLGYNSMPVVCPECGYTGMTVIRAHVTVCTHCCAFVLCILCCWICAPLPYLLTSCKDVYHYCRNCRSFLGMYCPSNPDATSIYPTDLNR